MLFKILAVTGVIFVGCGAVIFGLFELDRMRTERQFPGMAAYKAMQAGDDVQKNVVPPKTATTTMGSVIK